MALDPKSTYYDVGGIESIDVIRAKLTPEQFKGFLLGNMIKYSLRMNYKDQMERDNEKVGYYQGELAGELEMGDDYEEDTCVPEAPKTSILSRYGAHRGNQVSSLRVSYYS